MCAVRFCNQCCVVPLPQTAVCTMPMSSAAFAASVQLRALQAARAPTTPSALPSCSSLSICGHSASKLRQGCFTHPSTTLRVFDRP